jgi:hypothetical protein
MAIESAASIANCIVKMLDTVPSTGVTDKQIEDAFQSYQNARFKRTKKINDFSNDLTREESYSTFYRKFLTVWVDPVVDEGYMGSRYKPWFWDTNVLIMMYRYIIKDIIPWTQIRISPASEGQNSRELSVGASQEDQV